ncbi:MAG: hypothetical protein JWM38_831 [Sphingomonas bacterium]|jgi:drug/metabolite transporter (DMT)-like permease|nr:hypothetical protein [Sphingomonas bacterium]
MHPTTLAALLMILSGSIHAVVNAILKSGRDKIAGRAIIDGSSALLMIPLLPFVPLPSGAWGWLAATAVLHTAYLYALVRAFQVADLSASYPILRGTAPLVTALVTLGLLGEPASGPDVAGIVLIGVGMFAMVWGRHIAGPAMRWSLATGILIAAYTIVDAQGVRATADPRSFIVWFFFLFGLSVAALFAWIGRANFAAALRSQWKVGVVAGALSIATYGMALFALSIGPTAPLAALRETGMVTALLISIFILKERVTPARIAGIGAILGGTMLIVAG